MKIEFQESGPSSWKADGLVAFACQGEDFLKENELILKICPWLAWDRSLADFKGKKNRILVLYGESDSLLPRVILVGLGKRDNATPDALREATAQAAKKARELRLSSILLPVPCLDNFPGGTTRLIEDCVVGSSLGLYRFVQLKTKTEDLSPDPEAFVLGFEGAASEGAKLAAKRGESAARAVSLARDLDNLPGNMLFPEAFALRAVDLGAQKGFQCSVMDHLALAEADMGCLLAVGQGSKHPPRMVIVEYASPGHEKDRPLVLVGKGVTFDSGGLCIKPAAKMGQMKCDMSGAAAVLVTVAALAEEKAPVRVIGVMPCAENMPDGGAFRPGDVVGCANGETVEVINTDAEGRLALCDALAWAQKQWEPEAIIDIATLTGACAIALGSGLAGLFCDDEETVAKIEATGKAAGENFWRLPLWKPYAKELESEAADIKHTGSREGGAIVAALFLKHFIKPGVLWAHMDIAGVVWQSKASPLCPVGATGFGAMTLLALSRGGLK